jgi:hypothetical protein
MLGLKGILSEQDIEFIPNTPRRAIVDSTQRSSQANFVTVNKTTGPKAVAFRDSFTVALQPLLSEHFSSIRYVWTQEFERKWIDRDRPDIVLQLFTERFLYSYRVKPAEHGDR